MTVDTWMSTIESAGLNSQKINRKEPGKSPYLEAMLNNIPLPELAGDYKTPLLIVNEAKALSQFEKYKSLISVLEQTLKPRIKASDIDVDLFRTSLFANAAPLYCCLNNQPRLGLLKRLAQWGVGGIAQSVGELERAVRAGMSANTLIYASPFKTISEISVACGLGVLAVEIGSLEEFEELNRSAAFSSTSARPLRLCFQMNFSKNADEGSVYKQGFSIDEIRCLCERLRCIPHLKLVGFSVSCDGPDETVGNIYKTLIRNLRECAEGQGAAGLHLEFVLIGTRTGVSFSKSPPADYNRHLESVSGATAEGFRGADFRVAFSVTDVLFRRSSFLLSKVVRVHKSFSGPEILHLDLMLPREGLSFDFAFPVSIEERSAEREQRKYKIVGRQDTSHSPKEICMLTVTGQINAGDLICFSGVNSAYAARLSPSLTLSSPAEILTTIDGDIEILKVRSGLDDLLGGES